METELEPGEYLAENWPVVSKMKVGITNVRPNLLRRLYPMLLSIHLQQRAPLFDLRTLPWIEEMDADAALRD